MKFKSISAYLTSRIAGFTIIEIILGIGMLTMFISANFYYYKTVLDVSQQTTRHIQSGFLLEEGIEAVKLLRDESWDNKIATLTPGDTYYLDWNDVASKWESTLTPELVEGEFTRSFVLQEVTRNAGTNDIDPSGGLTDAGTRKLIVTVSWATKSGVVSTESVETYITDLFSN